MNKEYVNYKIRRKIKKMDLEDIAASFINTVKTGNYLQKDLFRFGER